VLFQKLQLFGIGLSWGGYESLALLVDPAPTRSSSAAGFDGPLLRIHAGLECVDDLIADMCQALDAARSVGTSGKASLGEALVHD
jgi:cystathionine beta-lyase